MKFALGVTALLVASASAFAPGKALARSSSLSSATASETYTFTKSEEIFAEAQEVGFSFLALRYLITSFFRLIFGSILFYT